MARTFQSFKKYKTARRAQLGSTRRRNFLLRLSGARAMDQVSGITQRQRGRINFSRAAATARLATTRRMNNNRIRAQARLAALRRIGDPRGYR